MRPINLEDRVESLGISKRFTNVLLNNGIDTVRKIINYYPKKIVDNTLTSLKNEIDQTVKGIITSYSKGVFLPRGLHKLEFMAEIDLKQVKVIIFNRSYLAKQIGPGKTCYIKGKYNPKNNTFLATQISFTHKEISCSYNIKGISDDSFSKIVYETLEKYSSYVIDVLSDDLLRKYKLVSKRESFYLAHFPKTSNDYIQFLRRIKYEELLVFLTKIEYKKKLNKDKELSFKIIPDRSFINNEIKQLPFSLTNDQLKALADILDDLDANYPMKRMLEGDTGSGKTIVAFLASIYMIKNNLQVALMAPTDVLATQHYQNFTKLYPNIKTCLLKGSLKKKERDELVSKINNGEVSMIIGTHSLFSEDVKYQNLALTIIDEEHRFGVNERKKLTSKDRLCNVLHMSATPIPRSLQIALLGDMDISQIREMPKNRKPIKTEIIEPSMKDKMHAFIRQIIAADQQVFVVTPLILDSEVLDLESATKVYNEYKELYPNDCLLLHSKLSEEEKQKTLEDFKNKKAHILVATTVIEVGVDIKDVNLIVILSAERFGLSQLHQLRGRVGRSNSQGYCLLVSDSNSETSISRLNIIKENQDGFTIAEEDLKLRGPGEIFGNRQTGDLKFKFANVKDDVKILNVAKLDASEIIKDFDNPKYNNLRREVCHEENNDSTDVTNTYSL